MSKTCTNNLARSNSDSSRGIAGRGVAMQAMGWDLSIVNCHCCNKFGDYKNDCADIKAAHQQNRRRRQRQHKQRGGHQPHQPKPGGQQQQRRGGEMWCSKHKTTPTTTPIAAPGRPTGSTATPTSPKSVLRVFVESAARGILLCETIPTRSPASHSRRERSSLQPSPPKPE